MERRNCVLIQGGIEGRNFDQQYLLDLYVCHLPIGLPHEGEF